MFVLQHQPDLSAWFDRFAHARGQFDEEIRLIDRVHRIQAQAIDVVVA